MASRKATQADIAEAVGLSVPTLARIYSNELAAGAELIRRVVYEGQVRKAAEGNTSAAKFVMAELRRDELEGGVYRPRPTSTAAASPRKGKKEQRQEAAEQVVGMFTPGPPPAGARH